MIVPFEGVTPTLAANVFVAPGAVIVGDVVIGDASSVWYTTVVRGDVMPIRIGARVNIQDGSVIHVTSRTSPTHIGDDVTIGHRAIIHGCTIERGALIGMGAIILDNAVIGEGSLVGAGAIVTSGTIVPPGSLVIGAPARVKRPLTDEERAGLLASAAGYVQNAARHAAAVGDCGNA